jgi:hypothetical protein
MNMNEVASKVCKNVGLNQNRKELGSQPVSQGEQIGDKRGVTRNIAEKGCFNTWHNKGEKLCVCGGGVRKKN